MASAWFGQGLTVSKKLSSSFAGEPAVLLLWPLPALPLTESPCTIALTSECTVCRKDMEQYTKAVKANFAKRGTS